MEGARQGETGLYVSLSESTTEIRAIARSHDWSLEGIAIYEVPYAGMAPQLDEENTLYVPAEVELGERMESLMAEVDRVEPHRVVLDSCSELRLLAQSPLRFRRQLLGLKERLVGRRSTVLLIENTSPGNADPLLQSLVHGVLSLEQLAPLYGTTRRRLRVVKMREVEYRGGFHDFTIEHGGLAVYPRLVAAEHREEAPSGTSPSGVEGLDRLLGGGLDRGTSTLIMGAAGTGKTVLATVYATAAAKRGENVAMFCFDEGSETFFRRSSALGMSVQELARDGRLRVQQIDPAELSPGAFAGLVRQAVELDGARAVVIDSLNGYLQAMPDEQFLTVQLHELLTYLRHRGVVTMLIGTQHGLLGSVTTPVDVSYLADTVVLLRFFEAAGRVRKAVSVVKKRTGRHEDTIRELSIGTDGIRVGEPLSRFHGILTGVPVFDGNAESRGMARAGEE
jgi:circadian clock protein KaiC